MRKKVAIAVVALLGGALMLPNHEALAHGGGFGGGGFRGGAFGGRGFGGYGYGRGYYGYERGYGYGLGYGYYGGYGGYGGYACNPLYSSYLGCYY